jgi:putative transposase
MPNHSHLILTPSTKDALPQLLQRLHGDYARIKHIHFGKTGHLWQARYFSAPMDRSYFWNAMVYVEQNPQRAGLVGRCWDWRWSSASAHLCESDDGLVDLTEWSRHHTPRTWRAHLEIGLRDAELLLRIREATSKGWPLGSEDFLDDLEMDLGRATRPCRSGPKLREIGSYGV